MILFAMLNLERLNLNILGANSFIYSRQNSYLVSYIPSQTHSLLPLSQLAIMDSWGLKQDQIVVRYIEAHMTEPPESTARSLMPVLPEFDFSFVLKRVKYWKGIP